MAAISDFLETAILSHLFTGDDDLGTPPDTFIALFTAAPSDAGGGTEVSGGSYARVEVNQDGVTSPFWSDPIGGSVDNTDEIAFPIASANWGDITHIGIFDAAAAGNLLWHGPLTNNKTIETGDQLKFATGELVISLD